MVTLRSFKNREPERGTNFSETENSIDDRVSKKEIIANFSNDSFICNYLVLSS